MGRAPERCGWVGTWVVVGAGSSRLMLSSTSAAGMGVLRRTHSAVKSSCSESSSFSDSFTAAAMVEASCAAVPFLFAPVRD